jgi:peptidoglycan/LPS O-acetylase OafA/YrhL
VGWKQFYSFLACGPLGLLLVWGLNKLLYPQAENRGLLGMFGTWGLAYAVFVVLLEGRRLRLPAWGLWVGRISYSLYLFHPLVLILLLGFGCPGWALMPALLVASLALAALIYHAVEEPAIRLGRLVEQRLLKKPAPAARVIPASA